jgi:hypothetical protein
VCENEKRKAYEEEISCSIGEKNKKGQNGSEEGKREKGRGSVK